MENSVISMGKKAKESAKALAVLLSKEKDDALMLIADDLENKTNEIISANKIDMKSAKENGISTAMQDRLKLDKDRIKAIADSVREVASLPDPVGKILDGGKRPNGIEIIKKTVPLGVVGLIYESRPNVTVDCAVLCLKAGNACILRGGSEAINSNKVLADILRSSLEQSGIPKDSVQLIENPSREYATELMELKGYIDVLIPRGGKGLINYVVANAKVPVIETGAGMCHIYVDEYANLEMAIKIVDNAKTSRPSVCNAMETLLVNEKIAYEFLPKVAEVLSSVEFHCCPISLPFFKNGRIATEEDYNTEYDNYIMNIKVVPNLDSALNHIDLYSTGHSEAIVTENYSNAEKFANSVDSAAVYLNVSTRFTDGGEFGLGAEIGIATQKLHVRGPMGLSALTSTKYVIHGNGQVR